MTATTGSQAWRVPYVDLGGEFLRKRDRYMERFVDVCADARFILRREVDEFEAWCARELGVAHTIGVGSGSDALLLALHALGLGKGDEVVTVAHTFVATVAAVKLLGATPVLVDITDDFNMDVRELERAITLRTKAVIPVHMNGRCCDMTAVEKLCSARKIAIVEDAAQAWGAKVDGRLAGSRGVLGCFSFHPMKVLHCFGDGGLVSADDADLAARVRLLRNHGQRTKTDLACYGYNSRLDTLQAAMLLENTVDLPLFIARKRAVAARYVEAFRNLGDLQCPEPPSDGRFFDVFTSFVVRTDRRDALQAAMRGAGIETFAHGDPPITTHPALGLGSVKLPNTHRLMKRVLSLPIFPTIADAQVDHVIDQVQRFFRG